MVARKRTSRRRTSRYRGALRRRSRRRSRRVTSNRASDQQVEREFKKLVNLTPAQIRKWHKDPRSKEASLPHIRAELPLLARTKATPPSRWTPTMRSKARRAVAFIKRHEAQLKNQDRYTRKRIIALLNWGRRAPGVRVEGL